VGVPPIENVTPLPDLSFHAVMVEPLNVILEEDESAASNHNEHPVICVGINPYGVVVIGILFQQQN
jgi:hypothetical protein